MSRTSTSCSRPAASRSPAPSRSTTPRSGPRSRKPDTSSHERHDEAARLPRRPGRDLRPGRRCRAGGRPDRLAPPPSTRTWRGRMGCGRETDVRRVRRHDFPKGLMVSQDGYYLPPGPGHVSPAGRGAGGVHDRGLPTADPVTEYDVEHEKELHLIAVRRDFSGFQHVHPEHGRRRHLADHARPHPRRSGGCSPTSRRPAPRPSPSATISPSAATRPAGAPAADSTTATVDGYTVTLDGDLDRRARRPSSP